MSEQLHPVDTTIRMPQGVRAAVARADEIYKQVYEKPAEPAAEEIQGEVGKEVVAEAAPAPQSASEPPLTSTPAEKVEKPVDEQSWKHRYESMKGRFDAAQKQVRDLSDRLSHTQTQFAQLEARLSQMEQNNGGDYQERLITPEEEKDYGPDFLNVVAKKAREELLPEINKRDQEIRDLKAQLASVNGVVGQSAKERMLSSLDTQMPNWREVNVNQNFIDWLKLPDAYSGAIRHNMLKAAYEQNDAPRVLAFFKGFLSEEAALAPATSEDGRVSDSAKIPLEQFAAPGRAKTAAASRAPAEKPVITRAQIAKFYADVAAGKYRGRDAEKAKAEEQLQAALREGRVQA